MKIAILLASYNGDKYIAEQLDSILNQSYQDFKIYISDDCSTDSTLKIIQTYIEKFPEQIVLVNSNTRYGSSKSNFLHLLSSVKADLYLFCDQDDVWTKDHISEFVEHYKKEPKKHSDFDPFRFICC